MVFLKSYSKYLESLQILTNNIIDLMESLSVWHDDLLSVIGAEELDIFEEFKLSEDFHNKLDLDFLNDNVEFLNSLISIGLKKSQIQNTEDFETFVKPCRFMMIFNVNSNELENPEYILFQPWIDSLQKWSDVKLYKINDDIKKFYDKLSSKTIEIIDGNDKYIYTTSNGSDWELQNLIKSNDIYQRFLQKDDIKNIINKDNITFNIV